MSQAHSLLQSAKFHTWAAPKRPSLLLVNGNIETSGAGRLSAMSYVCASLAASIKKVQPDAIILSFFCSLHSMPTDKTSGPNEMIRSLVWQMVMALVRLQMLDLEFVDTRPFCEDIEQCNLKALCYVFRKLLAKLPLNIPVYCLLDDIEWHEQDGWAEDLTTIIDKLCGCVRDQRLRPVFKLLMTSSHRSRHVGPALHLECVDIRFDGSLQGGVRYDWLMDEQTQQLQFDETRRSDVRSDTSDDEDWN